MTTTTVHPRAGFLHALREARTRAVRENFTHMVRASAEGYHVAPRDGATYESTLVALCYGDGTYQEIEADGSLSEVKRGKVTT